MEKLHNWINTVLILGVAILVLVGGNQSGQLGAGTRFPNGISTDSTSPSAGQIRGTTLTVTGETTLGNCGTASYTVPALSSSTGATATTTVSVTGLAIGDVALVSWTPQSATGTLFAQGITATAEASTSVAVVSFKDIENRAAASVAIQTGTITVCYFD